VKNTKKIGTSLIVLFTVLSLILTACGDKAASSGATDSSGSGKLKKLVIAEPIHNVGYLPLYAAIQEGYFKSRGLDVEVITATGGAHITSVVSKDAWGNIGGPESNAMGNRNNNTDPITSVVHVVNRANVYLMAKKGQGPKSNSPADMKEFLKGKTIAVGRHGGSPNLLTQYLLITLGLDPKKDVTLEEPNDGAVVVQMMENGQADVAYAAEPQLSEGKAKGIWDEPFYKFPDMGDYAYSVLSVRKSSITDEPETVQAFVDAILEALKKVNEDPEFAAQAIKKEFPTMTDEGIKAALDRAYADKLWTPDGIISEDALYKTLDVMNKTGVLTEKFTYADLVDMQFVKNSK
jgi:NitT/TauT family transport system substrate-binding protein